MQLTVTRWRFQPQYGTVDALYHNERGERSYYFKWVKSSDKFDTAQEIVRNGLLEKFKGRQVTIEFRDEDPQRIAQRRPVARELADA
jgi:hypothetical protein